MGTTSEKLTYLNTTKEKIRNSINLTGANLTSEDTFRSYASKLKKGYIDIINNGIDTLYNNFPKVSGIGSNLSLAPTYEAPIKLNEIQGSTLQDGTPTPDTPVEIQSVTGLQNVGVCGKNLVSFNDLQASNNTSYTWQNDILQVSATTGTYNRAYKDITDLYKNNPSKKLRFDFTSYDFSQGNDAKIQLQIVSNGITSYETLVETSGTINTRTIPNDTSSITQVLLRLVSNNTSTSQASMISLTEPILHFGETTTSYEPYKGNTYEVNLGKNLINYNGTEVSLIKSTNRTANVNFNNTPILEPGTYTLSLDDLVISNSNYGLLARLSLNNTLESTIYTFTDKKISFTLTERKTLNYIYVFLNSGDDDNATATFSKIQLEKGSQATSYSPYFTPIELNKIGDYQDSIKKSTGKNLFDGVVAQGEFNILGNINTTTIRNYSVNYIPVIPNENYVSNYNINRMCFYDKNKTFINRSSNYNFATFTIPSNAYYIRFDISTDYNASTMQIEKGSTATTYEPYGKVWYVENNIGKVVLNGSENWSENGENTDYGQYALSINDKQYGNDLLSDKFVAHTGATGNYIWGRSNNNNIYITIAKSIVSYGLATFKTWLSNNNTIVYYVLATPTTTEITNTELIEDLETLYTAKSQEGTTNISITSEDLEMILNVSALKGDVE